MKKAQITVKTVNAYAAESKDTTLKYAVGSSYTLTIPDYIEANTDGQSVSVSDAILPWGYALDVTADFDSALKLNDFSDITLSYDLYVNDSKISPNDKVLTQDAGDNGSGSVIVSANVTGVPTYAGTYTATITFNAELKEVLQTDYTVEEIENDPHLFGIGMTKPEYVVAHFNDDYSSAVITKNGDDSDGRMREFDARKSPFSLNKETLSTVIVKAGVTSIGINAFYECSNLSKVQLPDGLQVIYRDAFYSCTSLENFYLSDDIMKIEEYAFYSCESLTNVKLPSNLKRIEAGTFSGCTNLNTVEMGNQITVIDAHAFSSCAFKNITLPSSLQSIGVWAFRYCNFLESIDIPETVTSIGSTCFADCKNLQNINLPSGLTEIASSTFNNCSSLETIDIPTGVTSIGAKLYVKEISTDSHYLLSDEKYPVVFEYAGQHVATVNLSVNNGEPIENDLIYGTVKGLKIDRETDETITGALFGLFKADETEFTEKTAILLAKSNENGIFTFENVPFGEWTVKELQPADGYLENTDIHHIQIGGNEQIIEITAVNDHVPETVLLPVLDIPQTGDDRNLGFWFGLGAVALGGILSAGIMAIKSKRDDEDA